MKIIEDLNYMFETNEYMMSHLKISQPNYSDAYEAIMDAIDWLVESVFVALTAHLSILMSDNTSSNPIAFIGVNEEDDNVTIYLNIYELVKDYESGAYMTDMSFAEEMGCYEYAKFVFLHEIGHLVHGVLEIRGERSLKDRMDEYRLKYESYYLSLDKQVSKCSQKDKECNAKKKYRRIPTERQADSFARRYSPEITPY